MKKIKKNKKYLSFYLEINGQNNTFVQVKSSENWKSVSDAQRKEQSERFQHSLFIVLI